MDNVIQKLQTNFFQPMFHNSLPKYMYVKAQKVIGLGIYKLIFDTDHAFVPKLWPKLIKLTTAVCSCPNRTARCSSWPSTLAAAPHSKQPPSLIWEIFYEAPFWPKNFLEKILVLVTISEKFSSKLTKNGFDCFGLNDS
jgi:hypothetical protein